MCEGGYLAFSCEYEYANIQYMNSDELFLKGTDYMICSVAKSLGLMVTVRPVVEGENHWYLLPKFIAGDSFGKAHEAHRSREGWCEDSLILKALQDSYPYDEPPESAEVSGIVWCKLVPDWHIKLAHDGTNGNHQVIGAYTNYFNLCPYPNYSNLCPCYQAAILLVEVPGWGQAPARTTVTEDSSLEADSAKRIRITNPLDRERILYWKK